jgi:EAL domain-containing protein (putative c-di-GMP-specific phosphodiesterase class I)/FixJ family two-component response regulator
MVMTVQAQDASTGAPQAAPSRFDVHPEIASGGVLLVDDCPIQRMVVLDQLREAGVSRLFEATDGEGALQQLRQLGTPPAIVVLDLNMPRMDGFETMRQLATFAQRPALVILSGSDASLLDSMSALAEELKLQYLGAVSKPLDMGRLQEAFARYQPDAPRRAAYAGAAQDEVLLELLDVALQSEWIIAHYQPKIDLRTGEVVGLEALARWRRPDGSMISPAQFIGVAEREGRVDMLTLRMLDVVLADLVNWKDYGFTPSVSINVSSHSLSQRELCDEFIERVEISGIVAQQIIIEITESALASNTAIALSCIGRLRMRGFGLSIDDYGTGFSSLLQLSRMPFTELKIDRSFVNKAKDNPRQRTILGSAIDIGQRLNLHTVAEGIETIEDLAVVSQMGCSMGQGYLLAKPMDPSALLPWRAEAGARVAQMCREAACA